MALRGATALATLLACASIVLAQSSTTSPNTTVAPDYPTNPLNSPADVAGALSFAAVYFLVPIGIYLYMVLTPLVAEAEIGEDEATRSRQTGAQSPTSPRTVKSDGRDETPVSVPMSPVNSHDSGQLSESVGRRESQRASSTAGEVPAAVEAGFDAPSGGVDIARGRLRGLSFIEKDGRRLPRFGRLGPPEVPVTLSFENIGYSVVAKRPKEAGAGPVGSKTPTYTKQILKNLSGVLKAGSLCAIMGPSGCGKSTLLDILAGRKSASEGSVAVNGRPRDGYYRRLSAYVMQSDVLFPNLTVRETLMFAAELRLPPSMTYDEKLQRVEKVIASLELSLVADARIGAESSGLSGGQKRRVSVGTELLTFPSTEAVLRRH